MRRERGGGGGWDRFVSVTDSTLLDFETRYTPPMAALACSAGEMEEVELR